MPKVTVNGASLYYEEQGAGSETVVFAHGLLWDVRVFAPQVAALRDRYRCVAFDFRGQGRSEVTADGYDMETLTEDAAGLIRALGAAPCHFVGLSMGGFVGMRLALRHTELVRSLCLIECTADAEPRENVLPYTLMAAVARWMTPRLVTARVTRQMFGDQFINDPARAGEREEFRRRLLANDPVGTYRATLGVVRRRPIYDEIDRISVPTLVVVGDQDRATVPEKARRIRERIPGARLVSIAGAGHTSPLEEPAAVTQAVADFLAEVGGARRAAAAGGV